MEVIDADGRGNFAEISLRCGGVPLLFSRTVRLYDSGGEFIFREEDAVHDMNGLVDEIKDYMVMKRLPLFLARELYPYAVMSGLEGKRFEGLPGMEDTVTLVRTLL
jgi:hypothetical protein